MKKLIILAVVSLFVTRIIAYAATATGTATAEVLDSLDVSETQQMNFGRFVTNAVSGSVVLSYLGGVTSATHMVLMQGAAGRFTIDGIPDSNVTITVTDTTLTGIGAPMTVSNYTSPNIPNMSLNAVGIGVVNLGATLSVNANQTPGVYSGQYTITVIY